MRILQHALQWINHQMAVGTIHSAKEHSVPATESVMHKKQRRGNQLSWTEEWHICQFLVGYNKEGYSGEMAGFEQYCRGLRIGVINRDNMFLDEQMIIVLERTTTLNWDVKKFVKWVKTFMWMYTIQLFRVLQKLNSLVIYLILLLKSCNIKST